MRKFLVNVNGTSYEILVEELNGAAAAPAAMPAAPVAPAPAAAPAPVQNPVPALAPVAAPVVSAGQQRVNSPMPGNILAVNVKVGDSVNEGDVLMILEAMKMENEIMAPGSGTISSVNVSVGASVNTGDVLCVLG